MSTSIVTTWLFSLMTTVSPPDRFAPGFPGWEETREERLERYESIASDLWAVAEEEKPLFGGRFGKQRTAALLLAVAFHESGFAKDVDKGPCYKTATSTGFRCDGGRSACLMQIQVGKGMTHEGWTKEDLFEDRQKCFKAALRLMRRSFTACSRAFPGAQPLWLSSYAGGFCEQPMANRRSKELWSIYDKMTSRTPIPVPRSEDQT